MFYSNFKMLNTGEEIFITKVTTEYEKDGVWVSAETRHGSRSGLWYYNWSRDPVLKIPADSSLELAICTVIKIQANQYEKARRAHHSLPQPLKIRVIMEGKDNKKSSIIVVQQNTPIELETANSFAVNKKRAEGSHLHFTHCDDVDGEERLTAAIFHPENEDDKFKFISIYCQNNSHYLNRSNLGQLAYKAHKEGKKEILIDSLTQKFEKNGSIIEAYGLVDLEAKYTYGIRFHLQTTSSSAVSYYAIPQLK